MASIEVTDERPLNTYRTEIPNIVFDIGLSCFELVLYAHLRRTAGAGGKCTKGVRRLSEETGMSTGQVSETRRLLCEPRPGLGGKPLIRVEKVDDARCGVRHIVTIVDVWRENFSKFDPIQPVNTPIHPVNTPCSQDERKKELSSKGSNSASAPVEDEPSIESKVDLPPELDNDEFVSAWGDWVEFRAERRIKPYQPRGAKAQLAMLAVMGSERAIAAIKFSIAQQYQGIYEQTTTTNRASKPLAASHSNAGTSNASAASQY